MPALTRAEAETRARQITVQHYSVDLDLTRGEEVFGSTTVIRFTALDDGDTFVELKPAALHSAVLDGRPLDVAALDDNRLPLSGLPAGPHELQVEADMRYSRTGEGMHRFTDPADGETYLYTQLFLDDVQRVIAAFDQPDLKAVFEVTVTAPPAWTVLGNGVAERTGEAEGRWRVAPTPPISTYLLAVAAGPWHSVRTEHAGLPFGLHCRRSLAPHLDADAEELLDITRRCFDRYHELFEEPYPFDSYDQAFVPEFNAGAMENPGLVTFRDEMVFRSAVTETERQSRGMVVAHEMAHMWFGDLVTLRWWDDIWLNESFAEYMGYQVLSEATRFSGTWTDFAVARKSWGYDADQRPSTHPVAPAPEAVPDTASALLNFDGISYAKGASALRQLVTWLGRKEFLAGINDHFARHRFGNAALADFIDSLARNTDRDVHTWADRWLRTTGVDRLTPAPADGDGGWRLDVTHEGSRPHRFAVAAYDRADTDPARLVLRERFETDVPAIGGTPDVRPGRRPDLVLLNDQDLTYAKIRFDARSWDTLTAALSGLPDPLSRALVWNAARDLVRDGELPPAAYLDLARAHLPYESDIAIVRGVLGFARGQIADRYLPAAERPGALAALEALARDLLTREDPGLRLTAVRQLIGATADTGSLRGWLAEGTAPGGPALDPELRWQILTRLSVLGAASAEDIAAELDADPSATGQEGAARCRAALPDPQAKRDAWALMFDGDTLSNYLFTATAQGFWQPEQLDLVREYVPRYFPAAAAVAARRGPALAEAAGRHAFPVTVVEPQVLDLGEECLRTGDPTPTPALRRRLDDQFDDLRRALRVRTG
ncbi:aminopeptidase N [Streptomyces sp. ME01-24h]|nr:aminopeptidase N [Streptomyces sp. ME19-03-3]MDX3355643.1 aminopeptidase N [Streptomyces sp. ME01-24h]